MKQSVDKVKRAPGGVQSGAHLIGPSAASAPELSGQLTVFIGQRWLHTLCFKLDFVACRRTTALAMLGPLRANESQRPTHKQAVC